MPDLVKRRNERRLAFSSPVYSALDSNAIRGIFIVKYKGTGMPIQPAKEMYTRWQTNVSRLITIALSVFYFRIPLNSLR